jgi:hypothetical protein
MNIIPAQAPNGLADVLAHFGDPKPRIVDGQWVVDRQWEEANLTTLFHPFLPKGRIYLHRLILVPTRNVLDRWQARVAAGDPYRLRTFGCFQPRAIRGTNGLAMSMHTLAIAWDANADTNPMIVDIDVDDPRRQTEKDIPDPWIADAKAEGFFYGGEFVHRFDPQHFQMATGC